MSEDQVPTPPTSGSRVKKIENESDEQQVVYYTQIINEFKPKKENNRGSYITLVLRRALAYIRLRKYKECIGDCTEVLETDKSSIAAYCYRSFSYCQLNQLEAARQDLNEILAHAKTKSEKSFAEGFVNEMELVFFRKNSGTFNESSQENSLHSQQRSRNSGGGIGSLSSEESSSNQKQRNNTTNSGIGSLSSRTNRQINNESTKNVVDEKNNNLSSNENQNMYRFKIPENQFSKVLDALHQAYGDRDMPFLIPAPCEIGLQFHHRSRRKYRSKKSLNKKQLSQKSQNTNSKSNNNNSNNNNRKSSIPFRIKLKNDVIKYTKKIRKNPKDHILYFKRSIALLEMKNYHDAIMDCFNSISIQPTAIAYAQRGSAWSALKEYYIAACDFVAALAFDPDEQVYIEALGACLKNIRQEHQRRLVFEPENKKLQNQLRCTKNAIAIYIDLLCKKKEKVTEKGKEKENEIEIEKENENENEKVTEEKTDKKTKTETEKKTVENENKNVNNKENETKTENENENEKEKEKEKVQKVNNEKIEKNEKVITKK
ncbi:tpr repeat containing protein [Anaeramoeba flamelloides]|uniref:Tpr repeat containing protein n=1 Tax=Anaeramoeba flamelloides TaxID=1746091 RepID=A0AAV8AGJ2_9EUKA|nr:tpr repeat containing protein [Anaeramoeba flamelloides]